ncbi:unnamed protein product [Fraxinus pennsylvanica]|uniref:GH10 domain-containing protein n=1 Tax=Fraxinus pennsylvanica TaxID=56036 RepID=A0AAD1ZHT8_9LAMI|nr:unnamed protein product [Fraxinus pennsylvanica]
MRMKSLEWKEKAQLAAKPVGSSYQNLEKISCFPSLVLGCASSSYDYSANIECLAVPLAPQYSGGIVENPTFDSAWVQISEGKETVAAFLKTPDQESIIVGSVIAKSGCWSMLKGGFTVDQNMKAQLYFLWSEQQKKSIEAVRKRKIRIHVHSHEGKKLQDIKDYQESFTPRFTASSFNNEMKWYYTEEFQNQENYTVLDAMISFLKDHGISIRGHNILWDKPNMNADWVQNLTRQELLAAAVRRMGSLMSRYSGDILQWDVMNGNLHFSYYEDRLGPNASAMFYKIAQAIDPQVIQFEEILREAYSHPAVEGIILWSGWNFGCSEECIKGSKKITH